MTRTNQETLGQTAWLSAPPPKDEEPADQFKWSTRDSGKGKGRGDSGKAGSLAGRKESGKALYQSRNSNSIPIF